MTKSKDPKLQAVLRRAHLAGVRAADEAVPTPMVVYEFEGLSDRPKEDGKLVRSRRPVWIWLGLVRC